MGQDWASLLMRATSDDQSWPHLSSYQATCDAAYDDVVLVHGSVEFSVLRPTLVCTVRNEERRLPHLLAHYGRLGVERFHIIDNASTDGTARIAANWPGVTLWRAEGSYADAAYGQMWIGAIVRRHGRDRWVLNVDCDEFLVYSGMEERDLGEFCRWLAGRGQRRLFAPLIDMYPDSFRPQDAKSGDEGDDDFGLCPMLAEMPYFDSWQSNDKWGYQRKECRPGVYALGGVRRRLALDDDVGDYFCLSKYPLSLWTAETAYANVHFPYPFELNPKEAFGALLHFKIGRDFPVRVEAALAENQHWNDSCEYRVYRRWLERGARLHSSDASEQFRGAAQLVEQGFMKPVSWQQCDRH